MHNSMASRRTVWAMFWIVFQLAALVGFIFIGIVSFKLTDEQMRAEAGKFLNNSAVNPRAIDIIEHFVFSYFSPNIAQPCVSFFLCLSYLLSTFCASLSSCICHICHIVVVCTSRGTHNVLRSHVWVLSSGSGHRPFFFFLVLSGF